MRRNPHSTRSRPGCSCTCGDAKRRSVLRLGGRRAQHSHCEARHRQDAPSAFEYGGDMQPAQPTGSVALGGCAIIGPSVPNVERNYTKACSRGHGVRYTDDDLSGHRFSPRQREACVSGSIASCPVRPVGADLPTRLHTPELPALRASCARLEKDGILQARARLHGRLPRLPEIGPAGTSEERGAESLV